MSKNRSRGPAPGLWVSQNYLTSGRLISTLLQRTSICTDDHVIEIGPGKGHVTRQLLETCGRLTAIELDSGLVRALREKFGNHPRLCLIHGDFLRWRLPGRGRYKVFSNLPFQHTTRILRALTEAPNPPEEAWLVMERGAAMRFLGMPHENLRSLMLKPRFDLAILHRFHREDFHPAPAVDVVMLHLKHKRPPDVPPAHWHRYEAFVTGCLAAGGPGHLLTKKQMTAALRPGTRADIRSGTLLYVQWLCLFRWWLFHGDGRLRRG